MSGSPWYRLALSILLLFVVIALWQTRYDELAYHSWGKKELINLGDATNFHEQIPHIKTNSYVSVTGILGNKAATLRGLRAGSFRYGRYQVRQLLGSNLYIEYPEEKYHPLFNPFTRVTVQGRLSSFGKDSEMAKVRKFFLEHYHKAIDDNAMLIVIDEKPRSQFIYMILFILSLGVLSLSFYFSLRGFRQKPHSNDRED